MDILWSGRASTIGFPWSPVFPISGSIGTSHKNSLLNLNSALSEDKISIIVKEGYITNAPLVIYNNYSEKKSNLINSNISINLEKNSSLKIINLSNENSINSFSNISQNIYLSDNAILKSYSLNYKNTKYIY